MHKPVLSVLIIVVIWLWCRLLFKKKKGQDIRSKKKKLLVWMLVIVVYYCTLDLILAPTMGFIISHSGIRLHDNQWIWKYVRGGEDFRKIMKELDVPDEALNDLVVVDAGYRKTLFAGPWKPNLFMAQYTANEIEFYRIMDLLNKDQKEVLQYEMGNYQYYEIDYNLAIAYNIEKQLLWIVYNNATSPPPAGSRYWIGYYDPDISWE
ncbi:MAG: hypothetical protein J5496_06790 [Lachnospiraceae bacterium]|nr:hypothetical protein [Lachnospiraceae bacterium]